MVFYFYTNFRKLWCCEFIVIMDLTGFRNARLIFDEPRAIFYSGQMLTGYIECVLTAPTHYAALFVTFLGEANVHWTEMETEEYNGIRRHTNVNYSAKEEYFNVTQCISGGGPGPVTLPPGTHKIPFHYLIPHTAPSSFHGERGSVSYNVRVYMDSNAGGDRIQIEKAFEVVAPLDLNKLGPDVQQPINIEFEEFYSCCCSSSPMSIAVSLPASGFCPGQVIPVKVTANNSTTVEVKKITFQLVKKECYHSQEPRSDFIPPDEVLESIKTGAILSNSKRETTYDLTVPALIAPNLDNCSIIDVGYFFKVMIKMSGCNDDLEDETEICLGLVPLTSLLAGEPYTHPMQSDLPEAGIPAGVSVEVHNKQSVQNMACPPTAYPQQNFPSPYPYPGEGIPLGTLQSSDIGFVNPQANLPYPNYSAPYPHPNTGSSLPPYPGNTGHFQGNMAYPSYNTPSAPPPS